MTWNFRIVKELLDDEVYYTVREVYYKGNKVVSWTAVEISPSGSDMEELQSAWRAYQKAFERPVVVVKGDEFIGEEDL